MKKTKKFLHHIIATQPVLFFLSIILLLVVIGTSLFHLFEGRGWFNSFYAITITMATVGYGDFVPVTHGGKIISIIFGFMGAPIFIGLTGVILQSKFQKVIKHSIHAYHEEIKEAQKINEALKKETQVQKEVIKEFQESFPTEEIQKKSRWKKLFKINEKGRMKN